MRFRLSNAQKKKLAMQGTPLAIALPTPERPPNDWFAWAKQALIEEGIYLTDAYVDMITIAPPSGGGLTGVIGRIVHDQESNADVLTWGVEVVVCHLDPLTGARNSRELLQWPGYAKSPAGKWPAEPAAAAAQTAMDEDRKRDRKQFVDAAFTAAGLSIECGGYPINANQTEAYDAGFQRGCRWAYEAAACRCETIHERFDLGDNTYAGKGAQDGWNAAAKAVSGQ